MRKDFLPIGGTNIDEGIIMKNPTKTRCGENIIGGLPHHVDVIFRPDNRIWYSEVRDINDNLLDTERYPGDMFSSYTEDSGRKIGALRSGKDIGEWHGIPVNIFSGGKIIKTIKPPRF